MIDDLILRCQKGDKNAFEDLVTKYQRHVYSIAYNIMGNEYDAVDVCQEVFIKIYNSIKNFKGEASISTWIYRITNNVCIDELRKKNRYYALSIDELGENGVEIISDNSDFMPEKFVMSIENTRELKSAIASLPADFKTIIVLRDIKGLSYSEISEVLECSIGTVKSRISRARKALVKKLQTKSELFKKKNV